MLGQLGIIIVGFADNIMVGHPKSSETRRMKAVFRRTPRPLYYIGAAEVLRNDAPTGM